MLCSQCALGLRVELTDVPDLLRNLDITRARQDQLLAPYDHGPRSAETPLPFRPHIAEVLWVLHNTLGVWVFTINERAHVANTPAAYARWLIRNLDAVQRCNEAGQLTDEVTAAIRAARRAIDRPDDRRMFLGPCYTAGCVEEVYGLPSNSWATCPACGAQHDITTRQQWLYQQAQNHLGTAVEISGFLRIVGVRCTASMIHNYAARKRLIPAGYREPSPLYRIRDVLDTIQDRYRRRTTKPAKRDK